jgi:hypothetical protein
MSTKLFALVFTLFLRVISIRASPGLRAANLPVSEEMAANRVSMETINSLLIVFSDLDGTLIHYPTDQLPSEPSSDNDPAVLELPPSSTGLRGVISFGTLSKCREIRQHGIKLVLVSGMRTATLLKRLPFLPRADAYCSEAGGRIFYPTTIREGTSGFSCTPVAFGGAQSGDVVPFGLLEDLEWRGLMEREEAAGKDGYASNEINITPGEVIPVSSRVGALWGYAAQLERNGFVVDTTGYSTCFRVNRSHQSILANEKFDNLRRGSIPHPPELVTSTNLGCIDIYPVCSGKKNW